MFVNFHMFLFLVAACALVGSSLLAIPEIPRGVGAGFIFAAGMISLIIAFTANRS